MTTLRQHAEEYLAMRRQLGFKLTTLGEKLMSFIGYLERTGTTVLTTRAALTWARIRLAAPMKCTGADG